MTEHSTAARSSASYSEAQKSGVGASPVPSQPQNDDSNPVFEASLRYLAADLDEIARTAPPEKRAALHSVMNLLRAIADT